MNLQFLEDDSRLRHGDWGRRVAKVLSKWDGVHTPYEVTDEKIGDARISVRISGRMLRLENEKNRGYAVSGQIVTAKGETHAFRAVLIPSDTSFCPFIFEQQLCRINCQVLGLVPDPAVRRLFERSPAAGDKWYRPN